MYDIPEGKLRIRKQVLDRREVEDGSAQAMYFVRRMLVIRQILYNQKQHVHKTNVIMVRTSST